MFVADSPVVDRVVASPNHGERRGGAPDMLLLHYTGMQSAEAALDKLCAAGSEVSAHYFVFEDGRIVQCVPEARRAWHAGEAIWAGKTDINSCSIGIEIANPGHDWGYDDFPEAQIAAVIALCARHRRPQRDRAAPRSRPLGRRAGAQAGPGREISLGAARARRASACGFRRSRSRDGRPV